MFCLTVGSTNLFHAPRDKPRVWVVHGSRLFNKKFCGCSHAEKIWARSLGCDLKRLPSSRRSCAFSDFALWSKTPDFPPGLILGKLFRASQKLRRTSGR